MKLNITGATTRATRETYDPEKGFQCQLCADRTWWWWFHLALHSGTQERQRAILQRKWGNGKLRKSHVGFLSLLSPEYKTVYMEGKAFWSLTCSLPFTHSLTHSPTYLPTFSLSRGLALNFNAKICPKPSCCSSTHNADLHLLTSALTPHSMAGIISIIIYL